MTLFGMGLSPRVRGNPGGYAFPPLAIGSIPACAGEPQSATVGTDYSLVYPRVCGGTRKERTMISTGIGLSPRVRGNLRLLWQQLLFVRSIPACAGEPQGCRPAAGSSMVYPRVCGGTRTCTPARISPPGLSPRVRGNPSVPAFALASVRSIPACAGEPQRQHLCIGALRVYPRVCGEPSSGWACYTFREVYPRVCGGTSGLLNPARWNTGLSPRVRGNLVASASDGLAIRSIPACAGEPSLRAAAAASMRVYPRVCGGTV